MSKQDVSEKSRRPGVCCCQVPVWADSDGGLSLRNCIGQTQTNEAAATVTHCSNEPAYWLAGFLFLSASMSFFHSHKHANTHIYIYPASLSCCLSLSVMFVWIPAATRNTNYCRTSRGVRKGRGGKTKGTRDVGKRLERKKGQFVHLNLDVYLMMT